jgi:hypothetical protein
MHSMPDLSEAPPKITADEQVLFLDKASRLSMDVLKCCFYLNQPELTQGHFTKKLYSKCIGTSMVLEDFLDFHGAKNSTTWFFYRELTATIRHLSLAGYCQIHINSRLGFYNLPDSDQFAQKGLAAGTFVNSCLVRLAPVLIKEAQRLKIAMPETRFTSTNFPSIITPQMLKSDIGDQAGDTQQRHIVVIASEFLSIADRFEELSFFEPYSREQIERLVPRRVNEVEIRRFEMLVHNLQSAFDTYVIYGGLRLADTKIKRLRSFFSIVFHLLQFIGRLLHLYERHLHEAGYKDIYKKVQDQLVSIIEPATLLDHCINYGLFYVCHYLNRGRDLAREILNENIARTRIRVGIPIKLGFHSRPSLLVAKIVQHYGGQVDLVVGEDRFDASSVLDIQWAGGKIHKENITEVEFEGDSRALRDIEILSKVNYGEDTMGKGVPLPNELDYLR